MTTVKLVEVNVRVLIDDGESVRTLTEIRQYEDLYVSEEGKIAIPKIIVYMKGGEKN